MLKHSFFFGVLAVFTLGACQSDSITLNEAERTNWSSAFSNPQDHATDIRLFDQGKKLGDAAIMYDALHHMLVREPNNAAIKDSLASLYFTGRMYGQVIRLTDDLLEAKPEDPRYLEMNAVSLNSLGQLEDALVAYQDLLQVDPNPYYAYQIATIQYGLNQYDKAEASVDNMLAGDLGSQKVNINIAQGRAQSVPMKAALLNIKGVLRKDIHKDLDQAKEYFQLAMAESPDFILASNNLTLLEKQSE